MPEGTDVTPSDSITTSVKHHGDIAVLSVVGVIDLMTAPDLKAAIDDLLGGGPRTLVVDLSDVSFMSSIGLTMLALTRERLGEDGGFAVVANGPATSRPIQLTGLDGLFSLCSTLDE